MQTGKNTLRISQGSIPLDDIISDLNDDESVTSLNMMSNPRTYGQRDPYEESKKTFG